MFKKLTSALLSLSFMSSCAMADFEIEYMEFYQEALKRNCFVFPMHAYFARLEPEIAGYCIPGFGILFNEDRWDKFGPYQKRELVFHELGHCVLGKDHSEPGLMAPSMHSEKEIKKNWEAWVNELFKGCEQWKIKPQ
jgi:hypothetical protein